MGIPSDRENYIHRLGRTGREGKEGEGILLLAPWEEYFLDEIKDLPVEKYPSPQLDPDVKIKVRVILSYWNFIKVVFGNENGSIINYLEVANYLFVDIDTYIYICSCDFLDA